MSVMQRTPWKQVNEVEDFLELVPNCHLIAAVMHAHHVAENTTVQEENVLVAFQIQGGYRSKEVNKELTEKFSPTKPCIAAV